MKTIKTLLFTMGIIASLLTLISCKMNKNRYEWDICISGSKNHPSEVYRGSFVLDDGFNKEFRSLGGGGRMYEGYWSSPGNTMTSADRYPLPIELSVIWFSFTEAKFYGGNFELPYGKIVDLFQENSQIRKSDGIGLSLRVGFAPGGLVTVWASCGPYLANVAHFQGKEMEVTLEEFRPTYNAKTIEEFVKKRMTNAPYAVEYLKTHTIDSEIALFKRYMERFNTGFKVSFASPQVNKISNFNVQFANGERLPFFPEDSFFSERREYASMKYFEVNWHHTDSYGKRSELQANVCIKREEFLRIYQEAWGGDHTKAVDVMVNISADNKGIEIYLTDGVNRYDFDKEFIQTEIWNTKTQNILRRSSNYIRREYDFTWDDYSD